MEYGLLILFGNALLTTIISVVWVGYILIKEYKPYVKNNSEDKK